MVFDERSKRGSATMCELTRQPIMEIIEKQRKLVYYGASVKFDVPTYCFYLYPYGNAVIVYIGDDYHDVYERVVGLRNDAFMITGRNFPSKHSYTIFMPKITDVLSDVGIIAHEALHVVDCVMASVGVQSVKMNKVEDEPHAYLLTYIVEALVCIIQHSNQHSNQHS